MRFTCAKFIAWFSAEYDGQEGVERSLARPAKQRREQPVHLLEIHRASRAMQAIKQLPKLMYLALTQRW